MRHYAVIYTQKPRNGVVLRKLDISDAIERINLPVEIFHCFDCRLIRDFTGGMNPKTTLTNTRNKEHQT